MRRVKQLGVDHVAMGGPPIPWEESAIRTRMERLKAGGLTLGNLMIGGFRTRFMENPGAMRRSTKSGGRFGQRVRRACR
jgi:hypothetical protein